MDDKRLEKSPRAATLSSTNERSREKKRSREGDCDLRSRHWLRKKNAERALWGKVVERTINWEGTDCKRRQGAEIG